MPIYEYACEACGHRFEVIQPVSAAPLDCCEKCGGKAERLLSSPAIQFKGKGWYVTDYARKDKPGTSEKSEKPESSESSSSADSSKSTETKTDTSASTKTTTETPSGTAKKD